MLISEIEVDSRTLFAAASSAQNSSNDSHLGASITIKMIIWFAFLSFAKLAILIKKISLVYIQKKTSEGGGRGSWASRHPDTHNPALLPRDDRRLIFIFCCRRNATLFTHTQLWPLNILVLHRNYFKYSAVLSNSASRENIFVWILVLIINHK